MEQCGESSWKNPSIISTKHKDQYKYIQYMEQTSITIVFLLGDYWPLNQHLYSGSVLSLCCVITLIFSIKQLLNKYDLDRSLFPVLIFCTLAPGFILWCRCAKTMNWENLWDYIGIKKKKKKISKFGKKCEFSCHCRWISCWASRKSVVDCRWMLGCSTLPFALVSLCFHTWWKNLTFHSGTPVKNE